MACIRLLLPISSLVLPLMDRCPAEQFAGGVQMVLHTAEPAHKPASLMRPRKEEPPPPPQKDPTSNLAWLATNAEKPLHHS